MFELSSFLSALGGTTVAVSVTTLIAKYAISKALSDIDKLSEKVAKLDKDLSVLGVRLEKLAEHDNSIKELQKVTSFLEASDARTQKGHLKANLGNQSFDRC